MCVRVCVCVCVRVYYVCLCACVCVRARVCYPGGKKSQDKKKTILSEYCFFFPVTKYICHLSAPKPVV